MASSSGEGKQKGVPGQGTVDCSECGGRCCGYVTCRIDQPDSEAEYDNIRWYLLHRDVSVFEDLEGSWFVQFMTPCIETTVDGLCGRYERRPGVCRQYGEEDDVICEYHADCDPYRHCFHTIEAFEDYLSSKRE